MLVYQRVITIISPLSTILGGEVTRFLGFPMGSPWFLPGFSRGPTQVFPPEETVVALRAPARFPAPGARAFWCSQQKKGKKNSKNWGFLSHDIQKYSEWIYL
jgi:hypothetical protein